MDVQIGVEVDMRARIGEHTFNVFRRRDVVAYPTITRSMLFSSRKSHSPDFGSSCADTDSFRTVRGPLVTTSDLEMTS